jgi:hypothetical protein
MVAQGDDQTVQLVLDYVGPNCRIWIEAGAEVTTWKPIFTDGQYKNPARVIGFDAAEGCSGHVLGDVTQKVRWRSDLEQRDIPFFLQDFSGRY